MQRVVHRVWLGPSDPPAAHDYADAWVATNPDWRLITWGDLDAGRLAELAGIADVYDAAPTYVHRADLILPAAVWFMGGVAVGYDVEPLRPIEPLIAGHDAWCTPDADGFPGQAFFGAAEAKHPALRAVLDRVGPRIAELGGWLTTPGAGGAVGPHVDTGPYLWGDVFGRVGERAAEQGLDILGDWRTAYAERYWEKGRLDPVELAARLEHAVVRHRFAGSWLTLDDVRVQEVTPCP